MSWDDNPPKANWLNQNLLLSRKRFLLTNIIWGAIGFLTFYSIFT